MRLCLVTLHVYIASGLNNPTSWHPLCRSYLAELLLEKGYTVHGLSRNAASYCSPYLASLVAAGEAVKALSNTLLYMTAYMFIWHFGEVPHQACHCRRRPAVPALLRCDGPHLSVLSPEVSFDGTHFVCSSQEPLSTLRAHQIVYRIARPQEIYNLAAQSHVAMSYKQPELTAAVSGLVNLT